jgi:hypothetical protein
MRRVTGDGCAEFSLARRDDNPCCATLACSARFGGLVSESPPEAARLVNGGSGDIPEEIQQSVGSELRIAGYARLVGVILARVPSGIPLICRAKSALLTMPFSALISYGLVSSYVPWLETKG